MSISGIVSNAYNQQQQSTTAASYQKQLQQLGQALQTGNLSAAQSDFASLEQAFSQASPAAASNSSTAGSALSPTAQALNQLGNDLKSGNLSAAQKDFSTVQQDIQNLGPPVAHHPFRHYNFPGGDASPTGATTQSAPNAATAAAAQNAYATLRQQLQQFEFGGGSQGSHASALQDTPPLSLVA
jgi:hypothetical protein